MNFAKTAAQIIKNLTSSKGKSDFSKSRDREQGQGSENLQPFTPQRCPYCQGKQIVKRGKRKKKYETVQLYFCKNCQKTFTPQSVKGKHYPLKVILEGLSYYNLGYGLEETARRLEEDFGFKVRPATIDNWVQEYKNLCRYSRYRRFGKKLYSPNQLIEEINLYHRQVYKFRIHKGKLALLLQEDIRHRKLEPLGEFLEAVMEECPHYLFKEGERISEVKKYTFDLREVAIRRKHNYANRLAHLVLQSIKVNKWRHEELQKFFLYNDSVTVATEVPVYLLPEDKEHMENKLDFNIPVEIQRALTGHIDLVQLRNGNVHILDYKPRADLEQPIAQLTLYAIALSRLTGLRLYEFKCAWFDENNYYEFFPLHVVYKLRKKGGRRVSKKQGRLIEQK